MEDLAKEQTLSLNGILESGETYVIAHNSANSTITGSADLISGICSFNGDDAIGLAKNLTEIILF